MGDMMKKQKQTNQRDKWQLPQQQGFTLIELMVSLGLGLLVVALVGTLYANNSDIFRFQRAQGEAQEKARYVLGYLRQNLQQVGYNRDGITFPSVKSEFKENAVIGERSGRSLIYYRYQKTPDLRDCSGNQIVLAPGENAMTSVNDSIALYASVVPKYNGLVCIPAARGTRFEVAKDVFDIEFKYGMDTNADFLIDEYKVSTALTTGNLLNIHAISVCVLVGSDTKLPLKKKGMSQKFTNCKGVTDSSDNYIVANGLSPVMTVVRTTIYLSNTPKSIF
jgi:prepilin-type N-terminal cleavage/methylation domain-containing protein